MKNKNNYWQFIRGICIMLVILIHTLYKTDIIIYNISNIVIRKIVNFAVAIFIFMAGYFTTIKNVKEFYKKKFVRLVPVLIIWDIIYCLIWAIRNEFTVVDLLKKFLVSSTGGHLYYIYVLLQLFLIAPFMEKYIERHKNRISLCLPLAITLIYNTFIFILGVEYLQELPLYQYYIWGWITYFYLGMLLKKKEYLVKIEKIYIIVFILFFLILSIAEGIYVNIKYNLYSQATSQLAIFNSLYSIFVCLIIFYLKSKIEIKDTNIIKKIGDYSFGIYLSHIAILQVVKKISNLIELNYYTSIVIIFILSTGISYIINKIYYEKVRGWLLWKK